MEHCLQCKKSLPDTPAENVTDSRFCSEDCENEYEPDTCEECYEELDPAWVHECPMTDCEVCGQQYNENTDAACPYCDDEEEDE